MRKIKRRKKTNIDEQIVVICPKCKTKVKLHDLEAWCFIILKNEKCPKCKTTMTHKDAID